MRWRSPCAVVLLILVCGCSYKSPVPAGLPESQMDDYTKGLLHGEQDAHGHGGWMLAGCLVNGFAPIDAWTRKPTPPERALIGKSPDYVRGYTEAYQKKTRVKNMNYAWKGCGCLYLYVYLVSIP